MDELGKLELFLLGSPRVQRDGTPIQVDTRKAIALLAYLAVGGESHRRDALATLLWPDSDERRGRAALRRTLSTANTALAGDGLEIHREAIGLHWGADLWIDLVEFRARLDQCLGHPHPAAEVCRECRAPLIEAVALYRSDFLAGFTLRDSPAFDDWQFLQTENLRRKLAGALDRLARCHISQGAHQPAIDLTHRWLALDPLDEAAHRRLMQLYSWSGQRAAALRQYRQCVGTLDRELGVAPLEETTQLYQAIRENRGASLAEPVPFQPSAQTGRQAQGAQTGRPSGYPMVGRSAELEVLLRAYEGIGADGHLLVLEGEAGVGKTRLAREFMAKVRARGTGTIETRCYQGESNLAYGPFSEGLRAAISALDGSLGKVEGIATHWLGEVARLLPDLGFTRRGLQPALPLDNPGAQIPAAVLGDGMGGRPSRSS